MVEPGAIAMPRTIGHRVRSVTRGDWVSRFSKQTEHQVSKRRRQQRAVDDVEDAAEAGDEGAAVFHFRIALHQGFEQIAELSDAAEDGAEDEAFPPWNVADPRSAR